MGLWFCFFVVFIFYFYFIHQERNIKQVINSSTKRVVWSFFFFFFCSHRYTIKARPFQCAAEYDDVMWSIRIDVVRWKISRWEKSEHFISKKKIEALFFTTERKKKHGRRLTKKIFNDGIDLKNKIWVSISLLSFRLSFLFIEITSRANSTHQKKTKFYYEEYSERMNIKKKNIVFKIMAQERTLTPLTHSEELTVFFQYTQEQKIWIFFPPFYSLVVIFFLFLYFTLVFRVWDYYLTAFFFETIRTARDTRQDYDQQHTYRAVGVNVHTIHIPTYTRTEKEKWKRERALDGGGGSGSGTHCVYMWFMHNAKRIVEFNLFFFILDSHMRAVWVSVCVPCINERMCCVVCIMCGV